MIPSSVSPFSGAIEAIFWTSSSPSWVNHFIPRVLIKIAPNGAVRIIAITAVVNIIFPYSTYSFYIFSSTPRSLTAISRTIPPIAAWTVALGIHPNAINNLSFCSKPYFMVAK